MSKGISTKYEDEYYYAKNYDKNRSTSWCVRGPNNTVISVEGMDKTTAYIVGKLLSGQYTQAQRMLNDFCFTMADEELSNRLGHATHAVRDFIEQRLLQSEINKDQS